MKQSECEQEPEVSSARLSIKTALLRAVHLRCPQCGAGKLYQRWNTVNETCVGCGFEVRKREGDCWFFYYMSTAFLTGIIIVGMLLFTPSDLLLGRIAIGVAWLVLIVYTMPVRKGLAIAVDYLVEHMSNAESK